MKIKTAGVLALLSVVWLRPCVADEEVCFACLDIYPQLYVAFNEGYIISPGYITNQANILCGNSAYEKECHDLIAEYSDPIYELLLNGVESAPYACKEMLAVCSCSAGTAFNGDVCEPCSIGYYNDGSTDICHQCPSYNGGYGTTADSGTVDITDCYIPAGTTFNDETGSWTYTQNCNYKN